MGIQESLDKAIAECEAKHYLNSPAHATALIRDVQGMCKSVVNSGEDDPVLLAYIIKDRLPRILSIMVRAGQWANAVIEATPDQVSETGAMLCR